MTVWFHEAVQPLLVDITTVHQHDENPNGGDVDAIVESILVNGFYSVVIAQASTRRIIAGNHRYEALMSLGSQQIPVLFLDVTDDEALALLVGDNEIAAKAIRDDSRVANIVKGLQERGYRIEGAGFDQESLKSLVHRVRAREHIAIPEDISATLPPHRARIYIDGFIDEEGFYSPFDYADVAEAIVRLRDFGYRAVGMEGR